MKKLFIIALFVLLGIASCSKEDQVKIMVPAGAPALAQMYLQNSDDYLVDIVNGPDALVAGFGSGSHDFIFAPTNLGAKLYNNDIEYQFLAAITFGNYFLASVTEENFTLENLQNKEIVCFGMNATADIILRYVLEENSIVADVIYVDSLETANSTLIADNNKIILSAEPALSVLNTKVSGIKTIDLQVEYQNITGKSSYPQSGVFVRKGLSDRIIKQFLSDLESSVNEVNENLEASAILAIELDMGFPKDVLISAIPNSNIEYREADVVKEDLEAYFTIILDINPTLIGGKLPEDNFYYSR